MPELPEVERGRRIAERVAMGRVIVACEAAEDTIVYEGVEPRVFSHTLKGRKVVAVQRRGKHLFFELDRRPWPLFHFGMTGAFRVPEDAPLELASGPRASSDLWPPRFTKVLLRFHDGGELAMTNARRLGRIRLREDPLSEAPLAKLGFDPLLDLPTARELGERLARRSPPIKALLLDQGFAAGVGNWIADEVLYQSRIAPTRRASSLSVDEVRRLRASLKRVVERSVSVDAEKGRLPRAWLFHRRWGKVQGATTARGEAIVFDEVGGRTTAWVPAVQS